MKIGDRDTPGTRIYAEREFREDCPGAGGHRGRRRRHQPPVLLVHDQLRHPLESRPAGTAHGPHPPLRPGEGLPHLQLRLDQHPRGPRAAEALRAAPGDRGRPRPAPHGQGVQRPGRRLPGEPAGKDAPRHVRAQPDGRRHQEAHRREGRYRALPADHRLDPGRSGQARTEPLGHRSASRPRPASAAWCPR